MDKIKKGITFKGISLDEKAILAKLLKKKKPQVKNNQGVKRKGRLPAKVIINKLGNSQTVYYRPDEHTTSQYINPAKQDETQTLLQYGDSYKRMLFYDHDNMTNQHRGKGQENQSWGSAMTKKLDKLADKYGFTFENFDQKQKSMLKTKHKNVDKFLSEAEKMYSDLYTNKGMSTPKAFIEHIFMPTKNRIHSKQAGEKLIQGIQGISAKAVMEHNTPIKQGEQWKDGKNTNKSAPSSSAKKPTQGGKMKLGTSLLAKAKSALNINSKPSAPSTSANADNGDDDNEKDKSFTKKALEGVSNVVKNVKDLVSKFNF